MNPLHHALAILAKAESSVEADYGLAMQKAIAEVESEFALRRRCLRDAKKAIQTQLSRIESRGAEIYWHLHDAQHHDIQRETNNKIRRSLRRERSAKELKR